MCFGDFNFGYWAVLGWRKTISDDVFNVQTHLLHGVIQCNGIGQLIRVNGIEGGSKNRDHGSLGSNLHTSPGTVSIGKLTFHVFFFSFGFVFND